MPIDISEGVFQNIGVGPDNAVEFYREAGDTTPTAKLYLTADGVLNISSIATIQFIEEGDGESGAGAPIDARYLVESLHPDLTNEQEFKHGWGLGPASTDGKIEFSTNLWLDSILRHNGTRVRGEAVAKGGSTALEIAVAAASSGDTLLIPPGTWSGSVTIPAGVTAKGLSREGTILSGQITLSDGSTLENLTIERDEDNAGAIYGVVDATGGIEATLREVTVNVANATGEAYAVYMASSGQIDAYDTVLLAETGSDGYAAYVTAGDFYHWSGVARGTTALQPYYV